MRAARRRVAREQFWTLFKSQSNCVAPPTLPLNAYQPADVLNGIQLPVVWPPTNASWQDFVSDPPMEYHEPLATRHPPRAILVDTGRQLFVDDLVVEGGDLVRRWHRAQIANMGVVIPDKPWERGANRRMTARPFGGGVLYDPHDELLKLWYRCGWRGKSGRTCVAVSDDGLHFRKPNLQPLGLRNNVVLETRVVEGFEVVYDFISRPPRFVALRMEWMTGGKRAGTYTAYESRDGFRWQSREVPMMQMADRSTFFLNPLRKPAQWAFSLRENLCSGGPSGHLRARRYWEVSHDSFLPPMPATTPNATPSATAASAASRTSASSNSSAARSASGPGVAAKATQPLYAPFIQSYFQCAAHKPGQPVPWLSIDRRDCSYRQCDLYNIDGIAYESVMLHALAILHGPSVGGELKNNSIHLGFSRDGFHLSRPRRREPFIKLPEMIRNPAGKRVQLSNAQMAQGSPIVRGNHLLFYFGYAGAERNSTGSIHDDYFEATGLAVLRRDGFASLEPRPGTKSGSLTTRPLLFGLERAAGSPGPFHLFVNVQLANRTGHNTQHEHVGLLRVEALTEDLRPICGFTLGESRPLHGPLDSTIALVPGWRHKSSLDALARRRIRLRFVLNQGRLFSFWISRSKGGHSGGFLGGGGLRRPSVIDWDRDVKAANQQPTRRPGQPPLSTFKETRARKSRP